MLKNKFKKGDIIFIKHVNIHGKLTRHPLVITHFDEEYIRAIDERAILAAFTLSNSKSNFSEKILSNNLTKEELSNIYIPKELNPSPTGKDGVMQIDVLNLFSSDVLPRDLKGSIPERYVDRAMQIFIVWEKAGKAKVNFNNLPEVIHDRENNKDRER